MAEEGAVLDHRDALFETPSSLAKVENGGAAVGRGDDSVQEYLGAQGRGAAVGLVWPSDVLRQR
jgi:hypothetical protein